MNSVSRVVLVSLVFQTAALAQAPARLGYQGRLLGATGEPVNGVQTIKFALYDVAMGGSELWSETQSLGLSDGYYSTFLGDATPSGCTGSACTGVPKTHFDGTPRWLELTVGSSVLSPRQKIASVAYALKADTAFNVVGGVVNVSSVQINGTTVIDSTGTFTGSGGGTTFTAGPGLSLDGGVLSLGPAAGDLSGSFPGPSVVGLRGAPLSTTAPAAGQFLGFQGGQWAPLALPLGSAGTPGALLPGAGLDVDAGVISVRYGQTAGTAVSGDTIISAPITINVGAGGTFATLQQALASLDAKVLRAQVTLKVADGTYSYPGPVNITHPDGLQLRIVGNTTTPANVTINFAAGQSGFVLGQGRSLGFLGGMKISSNSSSNNGVAMESNCTFTSDSTLTIEGFSNGLYVSGSSVAVVPGIKVFGVNNTGGTGILADMASSVTANNAQVTGHYYGVLADRSSSVYFDSGTQSGAGGYGIWATRGGHLWARNATASGNPYGMLAFQTGNVDAVGAHANNNSICGFYAAQMGYLEAASSTQSGNGTDFNPPPLTPGNNQGLIVR